MIDTYWASNNSVCTICKSTGCTVGIFKTILVLLCLFQVFVRLYEVIKCFANASETVIATNKLKYLVIQPLDGVYHISDRSFRSRIGVPLICKKTILAKCIVRDAHSEMGHGRDVLQTLSQVQSKFFIPGFRKMITDMKKFCPGCIKLNKKSFTAFKADVPDVLKTVQPPFSFCQADIFGPILASQG